MTAVIATGFEGRTRLRLTRRGRTVFTGLAAIPLVIWAMLAVLGSGGAVASGAATPGAQLTYVTVAAGDSLWGIAEQIAPKADPRVVIDEIMQLNRLDSAVVSPGQRLALPTAP